MARSIKIDNALQKRFTRKNNKNKKEGSREIIAYFLIVCEGEKTEPCYFKSFPRKIKKLVLDIATDGSGTNTLGVVERAIEFRNKSTQKYDRVWVVFDKDSFNPSQFNGAIAKAKANSIFCAWSNEAFELWYILHFQNRITPMSRDQYKKAIEDSINEKRVISSQRKQGKSFRYEKNLPNMYETLKKYGNQDHAIRWAKELEHSYQGTNFSKHNPCTLVYKLVEELNGQSEVLNDEINEKYLDGK